MLSILSTSYWLWQNFDMKDQWTISMNYWKLKSTSVKEISLQEIYNATKEKEIKAKKPVKKMWPLMSPRDALPIWTVTIIKSDGEPQQYELKKIRLLKLAGNLNNTPSFPCSCKRSCDKLVGFMAEFNAWQLRLKSKSAKAKGHDWIFHSPSLV